MPPLSAEARAHVYQRLGAGDWKGVEDLVAQHGPRTQADFRPPDEAALQKLRTLLDQDPHHREALTLFLCSEVPGRRSLALLILRRLRTGLCVETLRARLDFIRSRTPGMDWPWHEPGEPREPRPGSHFQDFLQRGPDAGREARDQVSNILSGLLEQGDQGAWDVLEEFRCYFRRLGKEPRVDRWLELRTSRMREGDARRGVIAGGKAVVGEGEGGFLAPRASGCGPVSAQGSQGSSPRGDEPRGGGAIRLSNLATGHRSAGTSPAVACFSEIGGVAGMSLLTALASGDGEAAAAWCQANPKATLKALGITPGESCARLAAAITEPITLWLADSLYHGPDSAAGVASALLPHVRPFPAGRMLEHHAELVRRLMEANSFDPRSIPPAEVRVWSRTCSCLLQNASEEDCWQLLLLCSDHRCTADLLACGLVRELGTSAAGAIFARLWDSTIAGADPLPLEAVAHIECLQEYMERLREPESYREDPERETSRDWVRPVVAKSIDEHLRQHVRLEGREQGARGTGDRGCFRDLLEYRGPGSFPEFKAAFEKRLLQSTLRITWAEGPPKWQQVALESWAIHWVTGDWSLIEAEAWPQYREALLADLGSLNASIAGKGEYPPAYRCARDDGHLAAALLLMPAPDPILVELMERLAPCTDDRQNQQALLLLDQCRLTKPWWTDLLVGFVADRVTPARSGWITLLRAGTGSSRDPAREAIARIAERHPDRSVPGALLECFGRYPFDTSCSAIAAIVAQDHGASGFRQLPRHAVVGRTLRVCLEQLASEDPDLGLWHWNLRHDKGAGPLWTPLDGFDEDELAGYLASSSGAAAVARTASDLLAEKKLEGRHAAARFLMQHAARLRRLGHDPVALAVPALWGASSACTNDALRVLRSLLAQGHATHQEIADHVEPLLESEEESAWRGAARLLKELRAESPITLRNPDRIRDLVARDPARYEQVFKGLI